MQKVTSNSEQVALNAAPTEITSRFGSYAVTWSKVSHPSGNNIVSRSVNAALEIVKNLAKYVYNAVVFVPGKVYNLLYPNAVANAVANASIADNDDLEIQQDSIVSEIYNLNDETSVTNEENLPEPVIAGRSWLKTAGIGGAVLVTAAAALAVSNRYVKLPEFLGGGPLLGAPFFDNAFMGLYNGTVSFADGAYEGAAKVVNQGVNQVYNGANYVASFFVDSTEVPRVG